MRSVFSVILSLLLLCLSSFCFSCYFVFMSLFLFYYFAFISFCLSCYSVSFITLSLSHSFFPLTLSLCHSVFCLTLFLYHSVSCHSVSFHLFVALPLPFLPSQFGFIFTLSSVYFLIFLPEYLSI